MWLIQLKPGSDVAALLRQRRFLCQTNIIFETRKTTGIVQCKNCQQFGHTADNCARTFRCVKCVDVHKPGQCPTDVVTTEPRRNPVCVNCKASHPANYRGCPAYAELLKRKQERIREQQELQHYKQLSKQELQAQQRFKQRSFNTYKSPQLNFAGAASSRGDTTTARASANRPSTSIEGNSFGFIQQECMMAALNQQRESRLCKLT